MSNCYQFKEPCVFFCVKESEKVENVSFIYNLKDQNNVSTREYNVKRSGVLYGTAKRGRPKTNNSCQRQASKAHNKKAALLETPKIHQETVSVHIKVAINLDISAASKLSSTSGMTRMWTCAKCSYAYNPQWVKQCDICESSRTQIISKEGSQPDSTNEGNSDKARMQKLLSHGFDEVPTKVPMATFEQDLDDDFQFLPGDPIPTDSEIEWTCKKCTLLNNGTSNVCIVCGGSKLRSITSVEDLTLRKGEFWTCSQCTLKNSLASHACSACV